MKDDAKFVVCCSRDWVFKGLMPKIMAKSLECET